MTATANVGDTGSTKIDALLYGTKWAVTNLTFSFPTSKSHYGYGPEKNNNFQTFNSQQKWATSKILTQQFEAVSGLEFNKVTETGSNHADLRFAMSDTPSTAYAYYPHTSQVGGDSWYNNSGKQYDNPKPGNYDFQTILHEIGHAVGLKHGHEKDFGNPKLPKNLDSNEFSVMTYRSFVGEKLNKDIGPEKWGYPQSLMMLDIAALQHMYGADYGHRSGDTVYSWSPSTGQMSVNGKGQPKPGANRIYQTVWDGNGEDTYDFSKYKANLDVDLGPGEWTTTSKAQTALIGTEANGKDHYARGNIANAMLYKGNQKSLIENAKGGSGNDEIRGNKADNWLKGNGGNDDLFGFQGSDKLSGGSGRDYVQGHGGRDNLFGGSANDTISGGSANDSVRGDAGADKLKGGAGDDTLTGNGGDDTLNGHGGDDRLSGGDGNDVINGDSGRDSLDGGNGKDTLKGGSGGDLVKGKGGDDRLVGGGGNDTLLGGPGKDDFVYASGWGDDVIGDFQPGKDDIDLSSINGVKKFSDLNIANNGDGDAVITQGGNTITLTDVSKNALDGDDFIF